MCVCVCVCVCVCYDVCVQCVYVLWGVGVCVCVCVQWVCALECVCVCVCVCVCEPRPLDSRRRCTQSLLHLENTLKKQTNDIPPPACSGLVPACSWTWPTRSVSTPSDTGNLVRKFRELRLTECDDRCLNLHALRYTHARAHT